MRNFRRYILFTCVMLLLGLSASACGDEAQSDASLRVDVIGWGPGVDGNLGFQTAMPQFLNANEVRVSLTQPSSQKVLSTELFPANERHGVLPKLKYGDGLRLNFELLDALGAPVASGATPLFGVGTGGNSLQRFKIQVDPVNDFAPVGAVINSKLTQTVFDYRALQARGLERWLGRVGHQTVQFDGGNRALVVGGGDTSQPVRAGLAPQFRSLHDDLMEFDPASGYFSDLSFDPATNDVFPQRGDRLRAARAFHTVTPIGDDKFLVIGGLGADGTSTKPLSSIELIDLNAQPGSRVQAMKSATGEPLALATARAFHTATYRPADNSVVVTGGVGTGGPTNILNSVEIIDLSAKAIVLGSPMASPRANHRAVLMGDEQTIWVLGGRNAGQALKSTETISPVNAVAAGPEMNVARFDFAALRLSPLEGSVVIVIGGYTSLEGAVTDTYELSTIGRVSDGFFYRPGYKLNAARGNPQAVELPNSDNIVVLGGRDANRLRVGAAEVLKLVSLSNLDAPYTAAATGTSSYNDRADGSATLLSNGKILLAGGFGDTGATIDTAEYFTPLDPRPATEASDAD